MRIYRDKKGNTKFLIEGNVFHDVEGVRLFLLNDKANTPNAVSIYMDKHLKLDPITKKDAISHIRQFSKISNKKAAELLQ